MGPGPRRKGRGGTGTRNTSYVSPWWTWTRQRRCLDSNVVDQVVDPIDSLRVADVQPFGTSVSFNGLSGIGFAGSSTGSFSMLTSG